jgi:hypothetical protein
MLVAGAFHISQFPSPALVLTYLLVIYTSPTLLFSSFPDPFRGFDLTPITLGETRRRVINAFSDLRSGRVAFECTGLGDANAYSVAALGYILADQPVDLFNAGYAEIGDAAIYERCVQFLNARATRTDFEKACCDGAIKYIVAFSEEFGRLLEQRGYKQLRVLEGLSLSPFVTGAHANVVLFELPWEANLITPPADVQILPNRIRFKAKAGQSYLLRFTAFRGWRAFQGRRRLPVEDAGPGMTLKASEDGDVTLKYRYSHYWT